MGRWDSSHNLTITDPALPPASDIDGLGGGISPCCYMTSHAHIGAGSRTPLPTASALLCCPGAVQDLLSQLLQLMGGGVSVPLPTKGARVRGRGRRHLSLTLTITWQTRGCGQLLHSQSLRAVSPASLPTGSARQGEGPTFLSAAARKGDDQLVFMSRVIRGEE